MPSAGPPSSLEPGPHGTVTLTHHHWKLTACEAWHAAGRLTCHPEKDAADAALALQMRPIRAPALVGKDPRKPVSVAVPAGTSPRSARVRLRAGLWEIAWPGHKAHDRFIVGDGDEFRIQLVTRTGYCQKVKRSCVLDPDRTDRGVTIPDAQRAPSNGG